MTITARRGAALMVTLWVLAMASTIALGATARARESQGASRNRLAQEQGRWRAQACARDAVQSMERVLASASDRRDQSRRWIEMSSLMRGNSVELQGCRIRLESRGAQLPLWLATEPWMQDALGRALGQSRSSPPVQSLVRALRADPAPSVGGLRRETGLAVDWRRLESLVAADDALVSLNTAPERVLLALPGMTSQSVAAIVRRKRSGDPVTGLQDLLGELTGQAASELSASFDRTAVATSAEPTGWILIVNSAAGEPAVSSELRVVTARLGSSVTVLRVEVL